MAAKALKGSDMHKGFKVSVRRRVDGECRYTYFAKKADIEGYVDVANLFKETADAETGHAHGHTGLPRGRAATRRRASPIRQHKQNLHSAVAGETFEYTTMYPGYAKTARDEGFIEVADWFETLAKAEQLHAGRFKKASDTMTLVHLET